MVRQSRSLVVAVNVALRSAFPLRTNIEHRRMGDVYRSLQNKKLREDHAKLYSNRWSELARLPYFDLCHMIVIDPMHNLLLGMSS
jgi:hypothetical protein